MDHLVTVNKMVQPETPLHQLIGSNNLITIVVMGLCKFIKSVSDALKIYLRMVFMKLVCKKKFQYLKRRRNSTIVLLCCVCDN